MRDRLQSSPNRLRLAAPDRSSIALLMLLHSIVDDQTRRIQQALLQLKVGAEQRFLPVLSIEHGDHCIRNTELQLAVKGHHVAEAPPALVRVQRFRRPASGLDVLVVIG